MDLALLGLGDEAAIAREARAGHPLSSSPPLRGSCHSRRHRGATTTAGLDGKCLDWHVPTRPLRGDPVQQEQHSHAQVANTIRPSLCVGCVRLSDSCASSRRVLRTPAGVPFFSTMYLPCCQTTPLSFLPASLPACFLTWPELGNSNIHRSKTTSHRVLSCGRHRQMHPVRMNEWTGTLRWKSQEID